MSGRLWTSPRTFPVLAPLLSVMVIAAPLLGLDSTSQRQIILIMILAMVVSGLNLCFGYAGELSLGQVAIYAAGAYTAGYLSINVSTDLLLALCAGALIGPVIGLVTGVPGLRLGGWSFAMVSFFLVLVIPDILSLLGSYTGGHAGLSGIHHPTLFGHVLDREGFYYVTVTVGLLWLLLLRNIVTSRYGRALLILRESPVLSQATGRSVFLTKLSAYVVGAIPAGIAGVLFAYLDRFLTGEYFSFSLAIAVLAACVLGGKTSVYGALLGAALLEQGPLRTGAFQDYAVIVYGVFLLIGGLVLPGGLVGVIRWLRRRLGVVPAVPVSDHVSELGKLALDGKVLDVVDVRKSFDGTVALDGVSIRALPGRVTSIIGPNGSGKTTLLNLINGYYKADEGTVSLDGRDVQGSRTAAVARLGVARTFQTPIVVPDLSVLELVAAGRGGVVRTSLLATALRLPSYRRAAAGDLAEAAVALRRVGLFDKAHLPSTSLPLGSRRLLELARALVATPAVILLDEVASGVDQEALEQLGQLVRQLATAGATVVLVEHNFNLVLDVSDDIFVLANGMVIASGSPAEIVVHPEVIEHYLGTVPVEAS